MADLIFTQLTLASAGFLWLLYDILTVQINQKIKLVSLTNSFLYNANFWASQTIIGGDEIVIDKSEQMLYLIILSLTGIWIFFFDTIFILNTLIELSWLLE